MQLNRADSKIGASKIHCQVETLSWLAITLWILMGCFFLTFSVPLGTPVTYVGIWLMVDAFFASPSSVPLSASQVPRVFGGLARTHLSHEFIANGPYVIIREIKLRGHALGLR